MPTPAYSNTVCPCPRPCTRPCPRPCTRPCPRPCTRPCPRPCTRPCPRPCTRSGHPNWRECPPAEPTLAEPPAVTPATQKVITSIIALRYVILQLVSVMRGIENKTAPPLNFDATRQRLETVTDMMANLFPGLDGIISAQDSNTPQKAKRCDVGRLRVSNPNPYPYLGNAKRIVGKLRGKIQSLSQSSPANYLDKLDSELLRLIAAAQAIKTMEPLSTHMQRLPW
jgi:hypothetical protein